MKLLGKIWTTTTPAMLWRLWIEAVFKDKVSNKGKTGAAILSAGTYQVPAIVSAWRRNPVKRTLTLCLDACQQIM
ncbi:hypothetical protein CCR75_003611 [Bremia lactucae]|uniref:Uncharacterized protein n=1 Tax=Bremia lactucae TaxID=4779 RepID=A0A976FFI6_BRELC|nr:hypothetical protein CCR75_003611 [Bremia lactucae]